MVWPWHRRSALWFRLRIALGRPLANLARRHLEGRARPPRVFLSGRYKAEAAMKYRRLEQIALEADDDGQAADLALDQAVNEQVLMPKVVDVELA